MTSFARLVATCLRTLLRVVLWLVVLITALVIVWLVVLPLVGANITHRSCLELKNGLNLGYNAVFDLRRKSLNDIVPLPFVVPKYPDGTPLVDQSLWSLFITDTTVYGRTFGEPWEAAYDFAWRDDVGLVRAHDDIETYRKIVAEAGPANEGMGSGSYGASLVMEAFAERPEYSYQWCRTRFVVW